MLVSAGSQSLRNQSPPPPHLLYFYLPRYLSSADTSESLILALGQMESLESRAAALIKARYSSDNINGRRF